MGPLKENFFVKTSYAYFNLFKKLYFIVLVMIIGNALSGIGGQNPPWGVHQGVDFYNLFSNVPELFKPNIVPFAMSLFIVLANVFVFLLTYLIIIKLEKFLKNVYEENPFIKKNGVYLKYTGTVIMAFALFITLKEIFLSLILVGRSDTRYILLIIIHLLSLVFNTYFIIGLFIYTLGVVIIRGAKMKEELDLTV